MIFTNLKNCCLYKKNLNAFYSKVSLVLNIQIKKKLNFFFKWLINRKCFYRAKRSFAIHHICLLSVITINSIYWFSMHCTDFSINYVIFVNLPFTKFYFIELKQSHNYIHLSYKHLKNLICKICKSKDSSCYHVKLT